MVFDERLRQTRGGAASNRGRAGARATMNADCSIAAAKKRRGKEIRNGNEVGQATNQTGGNGKEEGKERRKTRNEREQTPLSLSLPPSKR